MTISDGIVSVVIPTRNRLPLLAQTLHTVLAQNVDLEVIVVDEGSSDDTPTWLAEHADPRVRTIRHDTAKGLSEARNAGIAAANGTWLGFVDDDDLWLPNKLSDQLAAAQRQNADWAFGGELVFSAEGPRLLRTRVSPPDTVARLPWSNIVPGGGSNVIVTRDVLRRVGGFDASINIAADWDLWIRLLDLTQPAVVTWPVLAYRIHDDNMSKNTDAMLDGIRIIEDRYRHVRDGEPLDWTIYEWLGMRALRSGDHITAARIALISVRAGHPGALRRLTRALIPMKLREPVADRADACKPLDRIRPRKVVPWPDGTEQWLRRVLEVTP